MNGNIPFTSLTMISTTLNDYIATPYIQKYLGSSNIDYLQRISVNINNLDKKFTTIKILPLEEYEQLKAQTEGAVEEKPVGGKKKKSKKHSKNRNRKTKKYRK